MKKILIINTGGTFNKVYNPITGKLEIETTGEALQNIEKSWLTKLDYINIIGKDSLEMNSEDREKIIKEIKSTKANNIIIIHGTDTIDKTAHSISKEYFNKLIVLTGAMVPYSINPIESALNLASAYGFIQASDKSGVYISMNGIIKDYKRVVKNKEKGYFEKSK